MISQNFDLLSILVKVFFVAIWTWFLNFLCSQGYTVVSWFLVILPFIFFIVILAITYKIFKKLSADQIDELIRREDKRYNR
jgi:H+/Cl- antiporter ClcA